MIESHQKSNLTWFIRDFFLLVIIFLLTFSILEYQQMVEPVFYKKLISHLI